MTTMSVCLALFCYCIRLRHQFQNITCEFFIDLFILLFVLIFHSFIHFLCLLSFNFLCISGDTNRGTAFWKFLVDNLSMEDLGGAGFASDAPLGSFH